MMNAQNYPQPLSNSDNAPFLEAWRKHGELLLQACSDCRRTFFYPRPVCPHCWSDRLKWVSAEDKGELLSFSLIWRPNHRAFFDEVPIILGEIRLPVGPRMLARVVADEPERLSCPCRVALVKDAARYPLPTFRPIQ